MFYALTNISKAIFLHSSAPFTRCLSQHALSIQQKIEKKRAEAILGGGQNRIDAQHKKVFDCYYITFCITTGKLLNSWKII